MTDSGKLICVIGDEDTVTGFLLAGCGHRTASNTNFLICNDSTSQPDIECFFKELTARDDAGIIMINQHIANQVRSG